MVAQKERSLPGIDFIEMYLPPSLPHESNVEIDFLEMSLPPCF